MSIEQVVENARASIRRGIGGIKIKVGHPDPRVDLERVERVRGELGDQFPMMVDASQQWNREMY
jgi:L-talarate/galactarate dehydratase